MIQVRNVAGRLVALRLNSGQSVYLPIGTSLELEAVELTANPTFEKLLRTQLLQIIDTPRLKPVLSQKAEKAKPSDKVASEPKEVPKSSTP